MLSRSPNVLCRSLNVLAISERTLPISERTPTISEHTPAISERTLPISERSLRSSQDVCVCCVSAGGSALTAVLYRQKPRLPHSHPGMAFTEGVLDSCISTTGCGRFSLLPRPVLRRVTGQVYVFPRQPASTGLSWNRPGFSLRRSEGCYSCGVCVWCRPQVVTTGHR